MTDTTPTRDGRAVVARVTGTVQGVGFRPFVARTAVDHDLVGRVRNTDAGVEVHFEGDPAAVAAAVETIRTDPPPLATVSDVETVEREPVGYERFGIEDSTSSEERTTLVPPDTAICEDCLADLRDESSPFHEYWATSCVNCGPRFTVTESLPYDRASTALSEFPPCSDCRERYENPESRRFHAQTVACPDCGPTLSFRRDGRQRATGAAAVDAATTDLERGRIIGVKNAGGSHLVCRATDPHAVERLRAATDRPAKPFAVMAPSVAAVEQFATVSERERAELTDDRRPIVLLDRERQPWLSAVAPGLHTVGVLLPYSGLHHRLFDVISEPLVVTSANRPGEPMCTETDALAALAATDAVLTHDRAVTNRIDDSVVRVVDGRRQFLRRSRGWVPDPLSVPSGHAGTDALAVGARTDVTVAATAGDRLLASQHVGRVDGPETAAFHREVTDHLSTLLDADPDVVAHDAHPAFHTSTLAAEYAGNVPTVAVYHHHAHAASLLADHGRERAVVVAADGTGYDTDGVVRGGEVLDTTLAESERVGGLSEFRLPGGTAAVESPARTLASLLTDADQIDDLLVERGVTPDRATAATIRDQAASGVASPTTTSAGRFLDAVAALLDVCPERQYRGQPAIRLEAVATNGSPVDIPVPITRDCVPTLDISAVTRRLAELSETHPPADVAATAQAVLVDGLGEIAVRTAGRRGVEAVGFTGGVANNAAISERLRRTVESAGLEFLGHEAVPPGDAGIAVGQAVAAAHRV